MTPSESNDKPIPLLKGKKTTGPVRSLHLRLRTDVSRGTSSRSICVSALTDKFIRSKSKRFSHFELVVPPLSFTLKQAAAGSSLFSLHSTVFHCT